MKAPKAIPVEFRSRFLCFKFPVQLRFRESICVSEKGVPKFAVCYGLQINR